MPYGSFNKAITYENCKDLKANHLLVLAHSKVDEKESIQDLENEHPFSFNG